MAFLFLLSAVFTKAQDTILSEKLLNKYHHLLSNKKDNLSHCLTPLVKEVNKNYSSLTKESLEIFESLTSRPNLNNEQIFSTVHFDIHYTQSGSDAVDLTDSDFDNIPDFVEETGISAEMVWLKDSTYGLAVPPSDISEGGSSRYDIYLKNIGQNLYGYENSETQVFDNPNTSSIENNAWTSYLVMNADYSWATNQTEAIQITIAHEFMHSIQSGYNEDMKLWLMEMTSTWAEKFHFPDITENFEYLAGIFSTPDIALNLNDDDDPDGMDDHWYSTWIFAQYICEHTDTSVVRKILEKTVSFETETAIENCLIQYYAKSYSDFFSDFIVSNYLLTSDTAFSPYTYLQADLLFNYLTFNNSTLKIENTAFYSGEPLIIESDYDGNGQLMRLSADYTHLYANQNFVIHFSPEDYQAKAKIMLLKRNGGNGKFSIAHPVFIGFNQIIRVDDFTTGDDFILIIYRDDWQTSDISSEQYTITVDNDYYYFNVFPNPARNQLNISFNLNTSNPMLVVCDITGRVISSEYINTNSSSQISVQNLQQGLFFINLYDGDILIQTKKFIKQ